MSNFRILKSFFIISGRRRRSGRRQKRYDDSYELDSLKFF